MEDFCQRHHIVPISTPTPFPIGPVFIYLVKTDPLTLIDAGTNTDEAYEALVEGLRDHGVGLGDIRRVILTHHHLDHIGMLGRIMEASGAESYGHPAIPSQQALNYAYDEQHRGAFLGLMRELGVPDELAQTGLEQWAHYGPLRSPYTISHVLEDHGRIGPFTVHFVPGHSATDTLLVNAAGGYAFTGDHILEVVNPNPMLRRGVPGQARPRSLVEYRQSLRHTHALNLGRCFPGHGGCFTDHRRVVDGIVSRQDHKLHRILRLVHERGMTSFEVAAALYPKRMGQEFYLCLSVAAGHLEVLEDEGWLVSDWREGVLYYSRVEPGPLTSLEWRSTTIV